MFKIGKVKLENNLILAPMAAVNCYSFRLLCKENGAGLVNTPMLHINQVTNNTDNVIKQTCFLKKEKPLSIQLVGSDPNVMKDAVNIIEDKADILDVNLGCPEKDILASKAGSFLVKHPDQIKKAVKPIIDNTNKPVTAKIRIGWDEKSINTLETTKILENLGVDAIAIHGRTKAQGYSGKADWNEIKKAKEQCNIPIIGNGDVRNYKDYNNLIKQANCDAVMIGRAAIGDPLIFKRILNNKLEQDEKEKLNSFKTFLKYYKEYENLRSFTELRQQAMWFMKGLTGAKKLRNNIMQAKDVNQILEIINN